MFSMFVFLLQDFYNGEEEDEMDRRTRTTTTTGNLRRKTLKIIVLELLNIELHPALVSELRPTTGS